MHHLTKFDRLYVIYQKHALLPYLQKINKVLNGSGQYSQKTPVDTLSMFPQNQKRLRSTQSDPDFMKFHLVQIVQFRAYTRL